MLLIDIHDVVDVYYFCVLFFFFKQKTAYEMRISDWSSDVCSSDLSAIRPAIARATRVAAAVAARQIAATTTVTAVVIAARATATTIIVGRAAHRSEEHTSELQSLMRISYAVFCLKKKNNNNNSKHTTNMQ